MKYSFLLCLFLATAVAYAQPAVQLLPLPGSFREPTDIVADPRMDDRLYIVEKRGQIQALDTTAGISSLWFDLSGEVDFRSEGGLLGMAFHPDVDSAYTYLNYTARSPATGNLLTTVARFSLGSNGLPLRSSRRILLTIEQPATNHNAGDLAFGPDNYLYIPTGDGGGGGDPFENGQDPQSLLGKLLRIDVNTPIDANTPAGAPNYAIPADNPFVNTPDTLDEIWSLGLRNPWRISFDRQTGDLWIADVGQGQREEVNVQRAGNAGAQNYGWNCREGFIAFSGSSTRFCGNSAVAFTAPELDYPHSGTGNLNGASITGGYVYRGPSANLQGYYIFGDYRLQRLFFYRADLPEGERLTVRTDLPASDISTFGEGRDGKLFVADYNSGTIYLIQGERTTATQSTPAAVQLVVYPNPANDQVTFTLPTSFSGQLRVELFTADGRRVLDVRRNTSSGQVSLPLPTLPHGVYKLHVTDGVHTANATVRIQG